MLDRVVVRLKRPSGAARNLPSEALNRAMALLADSDEMRPLLSEASAEGKTLAIEVFQNRAGRPILIHFGKENL